MRAIASVAADGWDPTVIRRNQMKDHDVWLRRSRGWTTLGIERYRWHHVHGILGPMVSLTVKDGILERHWASADVGLKYHRWSSLGIVWRKYRPNYMVDRQENTWMLRRP
jgi:hypothetical protein